MTQDIFDYTITDPGRKADVEDDVFSAVQGDLRFYLGGKEELFDEVALLMVSSSLLDQVVKVLLFDPPGHRRTHVIPDHEPVLGLKMTGAGKLEVSVSTGDTILAIDFCAPLAFARAVGRFHEAMVEQVIQVDPTLLHKKHLWLPDPATALLAERWGYRPRFQVLD